jgi:MFS family permease
MTQSGNEAAGDLGEAGRETSVTESAPWAPFRNRAFRWLWIGVLISWTGTWMQTLGAQWLVVDQPNAAALVSLVQAAITLPVMMLALPGGVLADSFDRRWLLFVIQVYFFVVGILLAVLTAAGQMPPALLIAFTFLLGAGAAMQLPTWAATVPELVPRTQLRAASRLDLVSVNVSRAVGPALAGVVIAHFGGVPVVFALNAASVVFLAVALLLWRRSSPAPASRERFVPALRAGGRYVWHEPVVRRIMLRAILFVAPAMGLWALLPVIASQHLGVGADGYGALFAALGTGAILGALLLGRVKTTVSINGILTAGAVLYAAALTVIILVPSFPIALATLVLRWRGLDGHDVDPASRDAAGAAGMGARSRHGALHGHFHGIADRRRADLGARGQPNRPATCRSRIGSRGARRRRRRPVQAGARDGPP